MFAQYLNQFVHFCGSLSLAHEGMIFGLFLLGLFGGASHCTGMCGPFVLSQTGQMTRVQDMMILPYHLGRMTTYTILGLLMYFMVNLVSFFAPVRVFITIPLLMMAGLLFLVNALPGLAGIFPWVSRIRLYVPNRVIGYAQSMISQPHNIIGRYFLGMILGLIPCGMVMAVLIAVSTAPNVETVLLWMIAFGVGTVPALVSLAVGGHHLRRKFPVAMQHVRSGLLVWSGVCLWTIAGFMALKG